MSRDTIYRPEIDRGTLPVLHAGRQLRIDPYDFRRWQAWGRRVSWQILVPFRSRSDSLIDTVEAARELPAGEDRAVARQLVIGALIDGSAASAGELIDRLEKASPAERRKVLDEARARAGLPTTGQIEFEQKFEAAQRSTRAAAFDQPPPRYALNESGLLVDLAEQEVEAAKAIAREELLRRQREEREAERAVAAAAMREHERARCRGAPQGGGGFA